MFYSRTDTPHLIACWYMRGLRFRFQDLGHRLFYDSYPASDALYFHPGMNIFLFFLFFLFMS
jgi:hypothetical protein